MSGSGRPARAVFLGVAALAAFYALVASEFTLGGGGSAEEAAVAGAVTKRAAAVTSSAAETSTAGAVSLLGENGHASASAVSAVATAGVSGGRGGSSGLFSYFDALGLDVADGFVELMTKLGSAAKDFAVPSLRWHGGEGSKQEFNRLRTRRLSHAVYDGVLEATVANDTSWRRQNAEFAEPAPEGAVEGLYYFYDDIANHSVLMMQQSLQIVEPNMRQVSMYISPEKKTFGWSYPVKTTFILNTIKANYGKVVVFVDTDMVFYRPWVSRLLETMKGVDLALQAVDTYNPDIPSEATKMRKSVSMAIMGVRCNDKTYGLFLRVMKKISCKGHWVKNAIDQTEFIHFLSKYVQKKFYWALPREFWSPAMHRGRMSMPALPVVCHPDKKKGEHGGQWLSWHRKTEWKIHHVITQGCLGHALVNAPDRGTWWNKNTLTAEITGLAVPEHVGVRPVVDDVRRHAITPAASYYVFSEFHPDDWSRFLLQLSLKHSLRPSTAQGPPFYAYDIQHINGSMSVPFIASVLATKAANSVTFFSVSSVLFMAPSFDERLYESFRALGVGADGRGKPYVTVLRAGRSFFAVRLNKAASSAAAVAAVEQELRAAADTPSTLLDASLFFVPSEQQKNASEAAVMCVGESLSTVVPPHWDKPKDGFFGYVMADEQYFHLLAYTRCGQRYSDPFHTLQFYSDPGEPVNRAC